VRLYSGPAFQPINEFLREIAWLSGDYRSQLAKHAELTFTATIANICRAIRKLAAVATPTETTRPLYRAVRGELPRSFWMPDEHGLVTATDTAFMSTSAVIRTATDYMQNPGQNVLWEIRPEAETDSGFHRGADIAELSQFADERETLFPPCTMLRVLCPEDHPQYPRWAAFSTVSVSRVASEKSSRPASTRDDPPMVPLSMTPKRSSTTDAYNIGSMKETMKATPYTIARRAHIWHRVLYECQRKANAKSQAEGTGKDYQKIQIEPTFI